MPLSIATALRALEVSTRRLADAGAEDFSTIAAALDHRHRALSELLQARAEELLAVPGIADRLRAALEAGAETCRKLRLVRATAQADLTRTRQEAFVLAALQAPAPKGRLSFTG